MVEDLEIQSLLIAARWACARVPVTTLWSSIQQLEVCEAPLLRPFVSGARVEAWAGRRLGVDCCFPQAVAASAFFRRHGHPVQLVIGVQPRPFRAHAWVELHGVPIVGGAERPGFHTIWVGRL